MTVSVCHHTSHTAKLDPATHSPIPAARTTYGTCAAPCTLPQVRPGLRGHSMEFIVGKRLAAHMQYQELESQYKQLKSVPRDSTAAGAPGNSAAGAAGSAAGGDALGTMQQQRARVWGMMRRIKSAVEAAVVEEADVVCATCSGAGEGLLNGVSADAGGVWVV